MAYTAAACPTVGVMAMPANFKYRDVAKQGRPRHERWDSFCLKHPPMTAAHWAKIFSPFDALDGFDERIAEKEVLYERQTELSDDDRSELDRRLDILHNLTWNGRMTRASHVSVSVTYFVPCADRNHFSFGKAGRYETVTGMVLRVEPEAETLCLRTESGEKKIPFCDIREIRDSGEISDSREISSRGIFETEWEF